MENYKKYKKAKKEVNLAKSGQVAGGITAGIGAAALGARELLKREAGKRVLPADVTERAIRSGDGLKKVGVVALPVGAALLAGSTLYKKKADKKLKEAKGDDNKKK